MMMSKVNGIAAKRAALQKEASKAIDSLSKQTGRLESKVQSKTVKIAVMGAGLLVGYGIYRLISMERTSAKKAKPKDKKSLASGVIKELIKKAVPFVMDQLQAKVEKNDSKATNSK